MIASIIGGAVAVVVIAGIIAGLAFALRGAEQRCADARVFAETKAGQLAIATAEIATWKNTAANERRRADALDDVLDEVATSGDAAGARARVLTRWAKGTGEPDPATGDDPGGVPAPTTTEPTKLGDGLIAPGD